MNRWRKDNRIESAEATAARRFGISEDALREIEQIVGENLASSASMLARDQRWAQPEEVIQEIRERRFVQEIRKRRVWRVHRYDNLAREFGMALRPLLVGSAIEYVRLLTKTITEHRGSKQPVHWRFISSRAIEFCGAFAQWEQSAKWLVSVFKTAGINSRYIRLREKAAFLTSFILWPGLAEKEAQKTIRHIARLAPEIKAPPAISAGPKGFDGLGKKKSDFSRFFDSAALSERQRECLSMKFEHELPVAQIARRLNLHRKTVQESLRAGETRVNRNRSWELAAKRRAVHPGSQDEPDRR